MDEILITGLGVISPAGCTPENFFDTFCAGRPIYGKIEEFEQDEGYRVKIGARVRDTQWQEALMGDAGQRYGRAAQYAQAAARRALWDAGFSSRDCRSRRVAVVVGTTMGEIGVEEDFTRRLCRQQDTDDTAFRRQVETRHIGQAVAEAAGDTPMYYTVPAACAAGNYAVAMAKNLLESDAADLAIAGGVDVFSRVAFAGFQRLLSLTPDLCRPFDQNRRGLVVGEGCGMVVLEKKGSRPGLKRYGAVLGVGLASNAYHMTAPHKNGEGERFAMHAAVRAAHRSPGEVDYISAHGTGTRANDRVEAMAITALFGEKAPPVSSIKSVLGHSMGAASILELIACCLMMQRSVILPTANLEELDEGCTLDVVPNHAREARLNTVLSNSFAFGGQTSSVLLGK